MDVTIKNLDVNIAIHQLSVIETMAFNNYRKEDHQKHLEILALVDCLRDAISESHKELVNI